VTNKVPVIELTIENGWVCSVCDKDVGVLERYISPTHTVLEPISQYWDMNKMEVYCSAGCGLKRHNDLVTRSQVNAL